MYQADQTLASSTASLSGGGALTGSAAALASSWNGLGSAGVTIAYPNSYLIPSL
jgi:hypothetical protein